MEINCVTAGLLYCGSQTTMEIGDDRPVITSFSWAPHVLLRPLNLRGHRLPLHLAGERLGSDRVSCLGELTPAEAAAVGAGSSASVTP
jgi:hypothetical protein